MVFAPLGHPRALGAESHRQLLDELVDVVRVGGTRFDKRIGNTGPIRPLRYSSNEDVVTKGKS